MHNSYRGNNRLIALLVALLTGCAGTSQNLPSASGALRLGPRPHIEFNSNAKVAIWALSATYNYIYGLNSKGNKTLSAIDMVTNDCLEPATIKVDHAENLWVSCGSSISGPGSLQEYAPGSSKSSVTFADTFSCGSNCVFKGGPLDMAFDSDGHAFAVNGSQECNPGCTSSYPAVWWSTKSPSSPPTGISDSDLIYADFTDVDSSGNLYVEGSGCIGTACGALLDEIANPTAKSPTITNLIAPGPSTSVSAIYVSNGGRVLNLVNSNARTMARYALPWKSGESPFRILGPTGTNYYGGGYPISGGFNRGDKLVVLGDGNGWLDVGKVASNHWAVVANVNLYQGVLSAAYVPSDK
jgi:hypothetical protein